MSDENAVVETPEEGTIETGKPEESGLEKQLKDTQAKLTQVFQERAELRERLAKLEGAVEAGVSARQPEEQPHPLQRFTDEEWQSKLLDDPKNVSAALMDTLKFVSEVLDNRDKAFNEKFQELQTAVKSQDPELRGAREQLDTLRSDPKYKGLPDEVLLTIAKNSVGEEGGYKGGPGSRSVAAASGRTTSDDKKWKETVDKLYKRIYQNEEV